MITNNYLYPLLFEILYANMFIRPKLNNSKIRLSSFSLKGLFHSERRLNKLSTEILVKSLFIEFEELIAFYELNSISEEIKYSSSTLMNLSHSKCVLIRLRDSCKSSVPDTSIDTSVFNDRFQKFSHS